MLQLRLAALGLFLFATVVPVIGHHSSNWYDKNKPFSITGKVAKVELRANHSALYVDVTDGKGQVKQWGIEVGPSGRLAANGWNKDTLKAGDEVSVGGWLHRLPDPEPRGSATEVVFKGKTLLSVSSPYF